MIPAPGVAAGTALRSLNGDQSNADQRTYIEEGTDPRLTITSKILPLIILLTVVSVAGWVGYNIYLSACDIRASAKSSMSKKNVVFTRDGVKVGVRHIEDEKYLDKTQRWVVKAWNMGESTEDPSTLKKQA